MKKKETVIGLVLVALLITTVGYTLVQQGELDKLRLEVEETIPFGDLDWGATFYFNVYRDGELISRQVYHNVITDAGRTALRGHIGDTTVAVWDYIAIGTGTGGGTGSTTLETEFDRQQGTYATAGSFNFTITYEWPATSFDGDTITETGVLNAAAAGTLLNYDDSFSRTLELTDSLEVIVNFQVGS